MKLILLIFCLGCLLPSDWKLNLKSWL